MSDQQKAAKSVYLDHSATTPVDPRVAEVMHHAMLHGWGNPSSRYQAGNDAKLLLEHARELVAGQLGAEASEVFFTSGGTEADNLALLGVMDHARRQGSGDHVITSAIEHSAVLKSVDELEKQGFRVTVLPVTSGGFVDPAILEAAIETGTVLVSVMHVNNELGSIQPIEEIGEICRRKGVLFHTDAVQSFCKVPLDVSVLPVDLVSVSSHKLYGPKGTGALYIRSGVELAPRAHGGGQEKGVRTGTENMPGIVGFGAAVEICAKTMEQDAVRIGRLRDDFLGRLENELAGVTLNGAREKRLYANANLRFEGVEAESLLLALDLDGIAVSTGSACSSGSTRPSHVLLAIGLREEQAHSSLRFTFGRSNSEEDVRYAAERVIHHVKRLREMAW